MPFDFRVEEVLSELTSGRGFVVPTDAPRLDLANLDLLPPVQPSKILCLGYNYRGHSRNADVAEQEYPDVFAKTPNSLIGATEPVLLPSVRARVDYEGEIAVIIGREAKGVALEGALDYVAGYSVFNDLTARDWQSRSSQFTLAKSFDGFGPLGPWLVTADEVPDPQQLVLEVERDGVVTVSQSAVDMRFSVAFVVHYLSLAMTLNVGDVIAMGTPQKLAAAQACHRPLAAGDAVTVRVSGIGELTTVFAAPPGPTSHLEAAGERVPPFPNAEVSA